MSEVEQTVDTAACVEVVRALVKAFEDKGGRLSRGLHDEYNPKSAYLYPHDFAIPGELIERGMKALGLPTPEAPKAKKIPTLPTEAQARVLDHLNARADARLRQSHSWSWQTHYYLEPAVGESYNDAKVTKATFDKLYAYKWIQFEREGEGYRPARYYKLSDAGREVLTRYQVKVGVVTPA